jgi:hypothetical protein
MSTSGKKRKAATEASERSAKKHQISRMVNINYLEGDVAAKPVLGETAPTSMGLL